VGLFDSFGAQSGGFDPRQFMAANSLQPGQSAGGFQPSQPVTPQGPLDTSPVTFQAPQQGLFAQMGQPGANGQTGWQNMGAMGKSIQDQPQQQAGPSMLQQGMAALLQQQPQLANHPVLQHLFQMPNMGGR
jgi:hypothetical protein